MSKARGKVRLSGPSVSVDTAAWVSHVADTYGCGIGAVIGAVLEKMRRHQELHAFVMGYPHSANMHTFAQPTAHTSAQERTQARRQNNAELHEHAQACTELDVSAPAPRASSSSSSSQNEEEEAGLSAALGTLSMEAGPKQEVPVKHLQGFARQLRRGTPLTNRQRELACEYASEVLDWNRPQSGQNGVSAHWSIQALSVKEAARVVRRACAPRSPLASLIPDMSAGGAT